MSIPHYIDLESGQSYPLGVPRWSGDRGAPIGISPLKGIGRDDIDRSVRSLWRYAAALPIKPREKISLGEGCTPLVSWRGHGETLLKLEWFAPTLSSKDRGATVMVSVLRDQGIASVLLDSSGNGGCATAAYSRAGGLEVTVLVPRGTPSAKISQIASYGASIEIVRGTREDTAKEALHRARSVFYANHSWQPFFLQGTKLLAYELWEDLGFRAPDNIVIPTGAGTTLLGCAIGFAELRASGEISRMPRLFAVQPANCAPIHGSYQVGAGDLIDGIPILPTIAEGTAISRPVRAREILAAIRESDGDTISVTEQEIIAAMRSLAACGFYIEPTSASAAAGLAILRERRIIDPRETTIVILTGSGVKATDKWIEIVRAGER